MQGWCTVQQHRTLADYLFEDIPNLWVRTLDLALCALDVLSKAQVNETLHDEWLEELESHQLWQTTLVQLELRTNDDYRTTRVVNALTQKVLTEAALLTLQQVRQRLERTVTGSGNCAATATVVEQCVDGLLKHALLVVQDGLWNRTEVDESLQTVVAVDHTTVEVVEVRGCETTTVELNHRTDLWWQHWQHLKNHRGWLGARCEERVNNLQALDCLSLLRTDSGNQAPEGC